MTLSLKNTLSPSQVRLLSIVPRSHEAEQSLHDVHCPQLVTGLSTTKADVLRQSPLRHNSLSMASPRQVTPEEAVKVSPQIVDTLLSPTNASSSARTYSATACPRTLRPRLPVRPADFRRLRETPVRTVAPIGNHRFCVACVRLQKIKAFLLMSKGYVSKKQIGRVIINDLGGDIASKVLGKLSNVRQ